MLMTDFNIKICLAGQLLHLDIVTKHVRFFCVSGGRYHSTNLDSAVSSSTNYQSSCTSIGSVFDVPVFDIDGTFCLRSSNLSD